LMPRNAIFGEINMAGGRLSPNEAPSQRREKRLFAVPGRTDLGAATRPSPVWGGGVKPTAMALRSRGITSAGLPPSLPHPQPRSGRRNRSTGTGPSTTCTVRARKVPSPPMGRGTGSRRVGATSVSPRLSSHGRGLCCAAPYGGSSRRRSTVSSYTHPCHLCRLT